MTQTKPDESWLVDYASERVKAIGDPLGRGFLKDTCAAYGRLCALIDGGHSAVYAWKRYNICESRLRNWLNQRERLQEVQDRRCRGKGR